MNIDSIWSALEASYDILGRYGYPAMDKAAEELGKLDRKKIAALVGLAPMNADSGKKRGYRKTKGGRVEVRNVLYMSTLAATRYDSLIQAQYQQLLKRGKVKPVLSLSK